MTNKLLLLFAFILSITTTSVAQDTCRAPQGLFASSRDSVASLNWQSTGPNRAYMVQWKPVRSNEWKTETTTTNTLILRGLASCTEYEFRVKTVCSITANSAYGESRRFKTLGCNTVTPCTTPREVKGETSDRKALFKWSATGARGYEVQYKDASNNGNWINAVVNTNTFEVANLKMCNKYFFRVRSICTNIASNTSTLYSEWSSTITVATTGCGTDTRCTPIRRLYVQLSSAGTTVKWDPVGNATYDLQVKKTNETEWRTISGIRTNSHLLAGLATCTVFEVRVKVNCSATNSSAWSYAMRFQTQGCQPICVMPRGLKAIVADSVAVLTWSGVQTGRYVLQVKTEADSMWRSINATGNVYVLTGLARCKKYVARIQAVCSSANMSAFTEPITFQTGGCQMSCVTPRQLLARIYDTTNAYLTWSLTGARAYIVEMKNMSEPNSDWRRDTVTTNVKKVENLAKCSKYAFRVRAICNGLITQPSETFTFETWGCFQMCGTPRQLKSDITADSTAVLYWADSIGTYEIQYRLANATDNDWKSVTVERPAHKLQLEGCKIYYWRVRRVCDTGYVSFWSELQKIETKGCRTTNICAAPTNLKSETSDTLVHLAWTGDQAKYEIQYRLSNSTDNDWKTVYANGNAHRLFLERCKIYYWRARRVCDNGVVSTWSDVHKFETRGCVSNPCAAPINLKSETSDSLVHLAWTGDQAKYEIQYRLSNSTDNDWKTVYASGNAHRLFLERCKIFYWRARRVCDNGAVSPWSDVHKFETRGCDTIALCYTPQNLNVEIVQDTTATLRWLPFTNPGGKFEVQYRIKGSGDAGWMTMTTDSNTMRLIRLRRCATYEVKIRRHCPNAVSDWSVIKYFETKCNITNVCPAPNVRVELVNGVISVTWADMLERDTVIVKYAATTDSSYREVIGTTPNGVILRGIQNCKTYKIKVIRKCLNGSYSSVVEKEVKVGGNCLIGDENPTMLQSRKPVKNIGISPNPGNDYIQVQYDLEETSDIQIQLLNLQGQVVKQLDGGSQNAGTYMQVLDNLTEVHQGMYFLVIRNNGKVASTQKWMKQ